jgi:hypothetical protein
MTSKAFGLAQLGNAYSDGALSSRNRIINGNFIVSQRGDYTSSSSPSDGDFTVDRWQVIQDGSPSTALIQNTDGSMKLTAGAATTGSMRLRQKFEYSLFPRQYDNKTFILSAKIKSNSQNARLNVYAGGYLAVSGVTSHSGSDQYETLTAIFTTPATITTEFSVHIGIDGVNSANTAISNGDYFEVKEVQLEAGDTATPFEHRSYGQELALCQRYYYRLLGSPDGSYFDLASAYASSAIQGSQRHPVTMRADPSVSVSGNIRVADGAAATISSGATITSTSKTQNLSWYTNGCFSGLTTFRPYFVNGQNSTDYLEVDAEL